MEKEIAKPKRCILKFMALMNVANRFKNGNILDWITFAQKWATCEGSECQWWWLCSGELEGKILNACKNVEILGVGVSRDAEKEE